MCRLNFEMEELIPIVAELAGQYTGFESTSVTYERAEQLMEAVLYCIREYETAGTGTLMTNHITAREAYEHGCRLVREKAEALRKLYNSLTPFFRSYGNICLQDTVLKGIPEFLKWYDMKYAPMDTIIMLDYPVPADLSAYSGVDAVYKYLKILYQEQRFLQELEPSYIRTVLENSFGNSEDSMENLGNPIFLNLMVHIMLKKPLDTAGFTESERRQTKAMYESLTYDELAAQLEKVTVKFAETYWQNDSDIVEYLKCHVRDAAVRIKNGQF